LATAATDAEGNLIFKNGPVIGELQKIRQVCHFQLQAGKNFL